MEKKFKHAKIATHDVGPMVYQEFTLLTRCVYGVVAAIFFVIICVQSLSATHGAIKITHFDKLAHFAAYFALAFVSLPALSKLRPAFVWVLLLFVGMGMEVLQWAMRAGRQFDLIDGLANGLGALSAIIAWMVISTLWKSGRIKSV